MTGAHIASQESHIFSADTTPDMYISDAIRISSGLPPVFKPFVIEGDRLEPTVGVERNRVLGASIGRTTRLPITKFSDYYRSIFDAGGVHRV